MIKAVIDRFEGEFAILLVGDVEQRVNVPRQLIPDTAGEGDWLQVEIRNGKVQKVELDSTETAKVKSRIVDKLEKLRRGEHLKKR